MTTIKERQFNKKTKEKRLENSAIKHSPGTAKSLSGSSPNQYTPLCHKLWYSATTDFKTTEDRITILFPQPHDVKYS